MCKVIAIANQKGGVLILGIIFVGIVAVLFLCVLLQETCDSLREKIRAL